MIIIAFWLKTKGYTPFNFMQTSNIVIVVWVQRNDKNHSPSKTCDEFLLVCKSAMMDYTCHQHRCDNISHCHQIFNQKWILYIIRYFYSNKLENVWYIVFHFILCIIYNIFNQEGCATSKSNLIDNCSNARIISPASANECVWNKFQCHCL